MAFREVMSKERVCTTLASTRQPPSERLITVISTLQKGYDGVPPGEGLTGTFLRLKSKGKWLDPR